MEDGLVLNCRLMQCLTVSSVLILVVMEDGLVHAEVWNSLTTPPLES